MFLFYDGPTPPPSVFADFDAIPHLQSTTETRSYASMSQQAGGASLVGFGNSFREVTYPNMANEDAMVTFFDQYFNETFKDTFINGLRDLDVQITGFDPQPVSVRIAEASVRQGGNALGLDPRHGDRIWFENNLLWASPLCNERCPAQSKALSDRLLAWQKRQYPNMRPSNFQGGDLEYAK